MKRATLSILIAFAILAGPAGVIPSQAAGDPVLIGAGDIAGCGAPGVRATAKLLESTPGTVMAVGDLAYPNGSARDFADCYDPTWGRVKGRTKPALGNHEYFASDEAAPYFDYWGAAAGARGRGFYSYDLGSWHIVVLNGNCGFVACGRGSRQERWLRSDLAASHARCVLAYWHQPLVGSAFAGVEEVRDFWRDLYRRHAAVIVNAHQHHYERFSPQDPDGGADPNGLTEFIVGTGGESHSHLRSPQPHSVVRNDRTFGVLKLTLHAGSWDWRFLPVPGGHFSDSGHGTCP